MIYNVSLKQLKKIANPFEQISNDYLTEPLKKEEIEKLLNIGGLNIHPKDSKRLILLKDITNKIINFTEETINIDITNVKSLESGWIVDNISYLAAALYLSDSRNEDMLIRVTGEEKDLSKLLKLSPVESDLSNNKPFKYKNNEINWNEELSKEHSDWNNPDWILRQSATLILENTDQLLWNDKDFVKKYWNKIGNMSGYIFQKQVEISVKSSVYQNIEFQEGLFNLLEESKDYHIFSFMFHSKETKTDLKEKLVTIIDEDLLNKLLGKSELLIIRQIQDKIPKKYIIMPKNIEALYDCLTNEHYNMSGSQAIQLDKYLPSEFFEDKKNVYEYMERLMEYSTYYFRDYVFKHWLESKESLQYFIEVDNISQNYKVKDTLNTLYKELPEKYRNDKDIIKAFINHVGGSLFNLVDEKMKPEMDIVECAALNEYKINHATNVKQFFNIENKAAKIKFTQSNPGLINRKNFPNEWKNDPEIFKAGLSAILWKNLSEEYKQKIITDKDYTLEVVKVNKDIYQNMPMHLKIDRDIVNAFTTGHQDYNDMLGYHIAPEIIQIIPNAIIFNSDILIDLIKLDINFINQIPEEFYNHKKFIVDLLSTYDENTNYFKQIIDKLPEKVNAFLRENDITSDYTTKVEQIFMYNNLNTEIINKEVKKTKKKI